VKYHVNPETGEPGVCRATVRACRYGDAETHFDSKEAAREDYEKKQNLSVVLTTRAKLLDGKRWDHLFPTMAKLVANPPTLRSELTTNPNRSISCPECGLRLGNALVALQFEEPGMTAGCTNCKAEVDTIFNSNYPIVDLNPDSPTYAAVLPENVSKILWYHWTSNSDWHEEAFGESGPGRIHLGSERAAADRSLSVANGHKGYLYVLEVTPEVTVDEELHREESNDFTVQDTNEFGAVRYTNMYEDTGSISLAIRPKHVKVVGYRNTSSDDIKAMSTYYDGREMERLLVETGINPELD
jgi:hypothetical protein